MLEQSVQDLGNDLVKMRQAAAQVMASTKQLEKRAEAADKSSAEWYRRAQLAVEKGEDDLAKEALKRRKTFTENAEGLRSQLVQQKEVLEKLLNDTRTLENKVAEAKSKKDTLKARAQSAKASRALSDLASGIDTQSSLAAFERMEEKVMTLEAEAEASGQVRTISLPGQVLICGWQHFDGRLPFKTERLADGCFCLSLRTVVWRRHFKPIRCP
mmetsp:Transcript_2228/g.5176  ORF Transcript_2228/g.5176 Transcript_2228/m.5176 type:complete len:214 (+) Transcript_2228:424-1065(+)